jgi:hypothetical protein
MSFKEIKIMSASRIPALTAIGVLLFAAATLSAPVFAEDAPAPQAAEARKALSIPQIYDKLTALGYWNIDKIERDPRTYEVRANDKSGDRVKLHLDAQTGEIVERRLDSRKRFMDERRRSSADCSERRCRDDLSASGN